MACVEDLLGPPNYALQKAHDELTGSLAFGDNEDCNFSPAVFPDDIMMDFDENLNLFFEQPLTFPNPKDLALLGIGDIMQPGLLQFEPNSANSMDEIDPLNSSMGRPAKVGRHAPDETRVTQDSSAHIRRESLISSSAEQTKGVFQTPGRDVAMKDIAHGSNKRELIKRSPPTQTRNASASHTPLGSNTFNYETLPELPHNSVAKCLPSIPVPPQVQVDCSLNRMACTKHSAGQSHNSTSRRPHTVKHFPAPVLHKHRGSVPNTVHSSDKALKQMFRNGYLDSASDDHEHSKGTSSSPALLNALLHGPEVQKKTGVFPAFESNSTQPDDVQNSCSVSLLCSALTAPLPSNSRHQPALMIPNRQSDYPAVAQIAENQRQIILGPTSCLITDSLRPSEDLRNMPLEFSHDFKVSLFSLHSHCLIE